jgi:hypothetical protein
MVQPPTPVPTHTEGMFPGAMIKSSRMLAALISHWRERARSLASARAIAVRQMCAHEPSLRGGAGCANRQFSSNYLGTLRKDPASERLVRIARAVAATA